MTIIKEKPMLMTGAMVCSTLADRKTNTRRIMNPQPVPDDGYFLLGGGSYRLDQIIREKCPYGRSGDRLWVRENFTVEQSNIFTPSNIEGRLHYKADGGRPPAIPLESGLRTGKWKPSIHMPRSACRLTLDILEVRIERLQDISEADAIAEGLAKIMKDGRTWKYGIPDNDGFPGTDNVGWPWDEWDVSPIKAYRRLWEKINGAGSWDKNPWVWVVVFKRVQP